MILIVSTIMSVSSSNWVMIWMSMEINTLTMCFLMSKDNKTKNNKDKTTLIYLVAQITASLIMLMSSMMGSHMMYKLIITFSMFMKMGMWPLHYWLVKILNKMNMKMSSLMIIMTWQKVMPMWVVMMMNLTNSEKTFIMLMILMSTISPLMNLKESSSLKSIMILSSINMSAWMMMSIMGSVKTFTMFFTFYSISVIMVMKKLKEHQKISETNNSVESLVLMSNMGGLPPLTMFWVKITVIKEMMKILNSSMLLMIMVSASIFLYNYLSSVMNKTLKMEFKIKNKDNTLMMVLMLSFFSLAITLVMLDYTQSGIILME